MKAEEDAADKTVERGGGKVSIGKATSREASTPQGKKSSKRAFNLSADELQKRRQEGTCFLCGTAGHRARACPQAPKKPAVHKPPPKKEEKPQTKTKGN